MTNGGTHRHPWKLMRRCRKHFLQKRSWRPLRDPCNGIKIAFIGGCISVLLQSSLSIDARRLLGKSGNKFCTGRHRPIPGRAGVNAKVSQHSWQVRTNNWSIRMSRVLVYIPRRRRNPGWGDIHTCSMSLQRITSQKMFISVADRFIF